MTVISLFGDHPLANQFEALHPEDVLDAVENSERRCTGRFLILNSYENRVYQLELEDESYIVGKFYRPGRWSPEAILDEHRFIDELAELEIPVATPLTLTNGTTVSSVKDILFAIFPRIRGRNPEEFDDEQLRILGRLLGRIHNVGARAEAVHRPTLTPASYGTSNLEILETTGLLHPDARDGYIQTAQQLVTLIEPLLKDVDMLRIHGDCHRGNLLWTPHGPTFLDFDDMVNGPAVQDLWMMLPSYDAEGQRGRDIVLESYEEFRPFNRHELKLIEPLRALRYIHYATWIARRWHDSLFKRTFSHFGSLQYWQLETQDLREQIARIQMSLYDAY